MSYTSDELLPLSALNDLLFCERRAALHLLERIWENNQYTVEGHFAHRRVDQTTASSSGEYRRVTGMMLSSYRLGLVGRADLVEFRGDYGSSTESVPYPVDFKRGRKRRWDNDEVQLCAQALCLEEMLGVAVPKGAIFHIRSQRRREVEFDRALRQKTEEAAARLQEIALAGRTPAAHWKPRCRGCSLLDLCLPRVWRSANEASSYLDELILRPEDGASGADP